MLFDPSSTIEFFFRVFGLYFTAAGIGVLINAGHVQRMAEEMENSLMLRFIAGILAFAFGVIVLSMHSGWGGWPDAFISLFGWAGLIKGLLILAMPQPMIGMMKTLSNPGIVRIWGLIVVGLGLFMLWQGFGA